MTAYRVVTDHRELENAGQLSHAQLDGYVLGTGWVVVSGSTGPIPPAARRLRAGGGISIVDTGEGNDIVVSAVSVSGSGTQTAWMERPSGDNDGVNVDFTLIHPPLPPSSLMFFINGLLQEQGTGSDYTVVSGTVIHLVEPCRSGSNLRASYPY